MEFRSFNGPSGKRNYRVVLGDIIFGEVRYVIPIKRYVFFPSNDSAFTDIRLFTVYEFVYKLNGGKVLVNEVPNPNS